MKEKEFECDLKLKEAANSYEELSKYHYERIHAYEGEIERVVQQCNDVIVRNHHEYVNYSSVLTDLIAGGKGHLRTTYQGGRRTF